MPIIGKRGVGAFDLMRGDCHEFRSHGKIILFIGNVVLQKL